MSKKSFIFLLMAFMVCLPSTAKWKAKHVVLIGLDGYIGRIIQTQKDADIYDDTIILITSDHGGIKKGHGGKTLTEMETPFIICGKNIKHGGEFKETMMQFDTATTIADIFTLQIPQAWRGQSMKQIFK